MKEQAFPKCNGVIFTEGGTYSPVFVELSRVVRIQVVVTVAVSENNMK